MLNAAVNTYEAKQLWAIPGWLPEEIGIIIEGGQFFCYEGEDLKLHIQRGIHYITVYQLVGLVADIRSEESQASHMVSLINGECPSPALRNRHALTLVLSRALRAFTTVRKPVVPVQ